MESLSTYGLIGYPLQHSLSPIIHNTAFKQLGLSAVYELFPLQEKEIEPFFQEVKSSSSSIFGLNVTIPYKEYVLKFCDSLSPYARKVGAVNTIVISKDRALIGHNTDGPGFLTHLTELGIKIQGRRIAMLGAGGAARALISVLCLMPERPRLVRLYDIDQDKGATLVQDLSDQFDVSCVEIAHSLDDLALRQADILINATPVGMRSDDPVLFEKELLHPDLFVYDLVYNPPETRLLTMAREIGARTSNGLGMLFYQAILALQHWADMPISSTVKKAVRQHLEASIPSGTAPRKRMKDA